MKKVDAPPLQVSPAGSLAYLTALLVVFADQISKAEVLYQLDLPLRLQIPVAPPFFNLSMVWNRGVSFGLLRAGQDIGRWLLVAFAAAVVGFLIFFVRKAERRLLGLAIGLIMGGAIGNNLIDRIRFGAVADFLDFSGLYFPWVFNVADSAITAGVIVLLVDSFLVEKTIASKKA